jgi:hypothetical protein
MKRNAASGLFYEAVKIEPLSFPIKTKAPVAEKSNGGLFGSINLAGNYIPIPGYPPPPEGMDGIAGSSFGLSATMHWVVSMRDATLAAFCSANRVTLVGSMTPAAIMSSYLSVWALNP